MGGGIYTTLPPSPYTHRNTLEGMMTGGLPTFIDAGSNFDSAVITEDNFIAQAKANGLRLAMFGDDTWVSLFPNM